MTNGNNVRVAARLRTALKDFVGGDLTVEDLQSALSIAESLLERDGTNLRNVVRLTEADLEEVRFTVLSGDQHAVALARLSDLKALLEAGSSPEVSRTVWGSVEVAGHGVFKDVLLTPAGAREWDWTETQTHHNPGVLAPVVDLLAASGATTIILSRGVDGVLQVPDATVTYAEALGLTVHVALTPDAVALYNELRLTTPVAAAIHSTC